MKGFIGNGIGVKGNDAVGLLHACALKQVADEAAVAEVGLLAGGIREKGNFLAAAGGENPVILLCHKLSNIAEIIGRVIREGDVEGDAGAKAGVLVKEAFHFIRIAGEDDDGFTAAVFHFLNDGVDGLVAVGAVAVVNEGVGFIDEENVTFGFSKDFLNFGGGLANVLANEVTATDFDELAAFKDVVFAKNVGKEAGNGGFGGAGVAGEDHVHGGVIDVYAAVFIHFLNFVEVEGFGDEVLGVIKADKGVQLVKGRALGGRFLNFLLAGFNNAVLGVDGGFEFLIVPVAEGGIKFLDGVEGLGVLYESEELLVGADVLFLGAVFKILGGIGALEAGVILNFNERHGAGRIRDDVYKGLAGVAHAEDGKNIVAVGKGGSADFLKNLGGHCGVITGLEIAVVKGDNDGTVGIGVVDYLKEVLVKGMGGAVAELKDGVAPVFNAALGVEGGKKVIADVVAFKGIGAFYNIVNGLAVDFCVSGALEDAVQFGKKGFTNVNALSVLGKEILIVGCIKGPFLIGAVMAGDGIEVVKVKAVKDGVIVFDKFVVFGIVQAVEEIGKSDLVDVGAFEFKGKAAELVNFYTLRSGERG